MPRNLACVFPFRGQLTGATRVMLGIHVLGAAGRRSIGGFVICERARRCVVQASRSTLSETITSWRGWRRRIASIRMSWSSCSIWPESRIDNELMLRCLDTDFC